MQFFFGDLGRIAAIFAALFIPAAISPGQASTASASGSQTNRVSAPNWPTLASR